MTFDNIMRLCREKGITISGLERETGLGNATVRGGEESTPKVDKRKRAADYLGVTVDDRLREGK